MLSNSAQYKDLKKKTAKKNPEKDYLHRFSVSHHGYITQCLGDISMI